MQWFDALREKGSYAFDRLVIAGEHSLALKEKLQTWIEPEITALKGKKPEDLISQIAALEKDEAVVFGMGNMGGMGRSLVDYWEMAGNRYDV